MTYRITLALPCGTRQVVSSLGEASLLVCLGWRFVSMRGSCLRTLVC